MPRKSTKGKAPAPAPAPADQAVKKKKKNRLRQLIKMLPKGRAGLGVLGTWACTSAAWAGYGVWAAAPAERTFLYGAASLAAAAVEIPVAAYVCAKVIPGAYGYVKEAFEDDSDDEEEEAGPAPADDAPRRSGRRRPA